MCLYTNKRSRIAKEDIQVFKVLRIYDGRYVTPYRKATLSPNKLLPKVKLGVITDYLWFLKRRDGFNTRFSVGEGYHSYLSEIKAINNKCSLERIFNATIPKGTRYYIDKPHYIVAETMIIHADINIK